MNILVTGSRGLIGRALVPFLTAGGHRVIRLVRSKASSDAGDVVWDPAAGMIDRAALAGLEAVVHLAGENIFGRWTARKKAQIRDSRVPATRLLSESLAQLSRPPRVFVCASAVGFYGDRGSEILREESATGSSFQAEDCRDWHA
jgi:NAD dependent epimerase/dehydratase family enzyme